MSKLRDFKIEVKEQGAPIVGQGYIFKKYDDLVAVGINMESKYCTIDSIGGSSEGIPQIIIGTNRSSVGLDSSKNRGDLTVIDFPDFKHWVLWSAHISKYVLSVCLVK